MAIVNFTTALKRFFPELQSVKINAYTIVELIAAIEKEHPGIKSYLVDNNGALREHVNIFIGEESIRDKVKLSDTLQSEDEVYIMQALSGG